MNKKQKHNVTLGEQLIMFFFGFIFVLILGRHYFSNLGGSIADKTRLMKVYYFGIIFWIAVLVVITLLENDGVF